MMPGETALTRMPREAYSTASDRVAAAGPPLVSAARTEGTLEFPWSARVAEMLTTWPAAGLQHVGDGPLGQPEEPGEVDAGHQGVVLGGVVGERLGDADAGVVDERADAAEASECSADDPVGGGGVGEVAVDGEHVWVLGRLHCAGG